MIGVRASRHAGADCATELSNVTELTVDIASPEVCLLPGETKRYVFNLARASLLGAPYTVTATPTRSGQNVCRRAMHAVIEALQLVLTCDRTGR